MTHRPRCLLDGPDYGTLKDVKVLVTGGAGSGKTGLIRALCGQRVPHKYHETVGLQVSTAWRELVAEDDDASSCTTVFSFWEVGALYAGKESQLSRSAREDAVAALVVFSMTDRAGFDEIRECIAGTGGLPCILVATKCDCLAAWTVTMTEVGALAAAESLPVVVIENLPTKDAALGYVGFGDVPAGFVETIYAHLESLVQS